MRAICLLGAMWLGPGLLLADWNPGDPYKMHYPQLPDPNGWDVYDTYPKVLADDWLCTETGPVSDVHFWGSWEGDVVGTLSAVKVSIHANDVSGPFSKPGELLWERVFVAGGYTIRQYGTGEQGWYDPNTGYWNRPDHFTYYQINIENIPDPFIQEFGTIYWLDLAAVTQYGLWGWKTSLQHFEDDAVWGDWPNPVWHELRDPITQESLDLAFVITPEPTALALLALGGLALFRRR